MVEERFHSILPLLRASVHEPLEVDAFLSFQLYVSLVVLPNAQQEVCLSLTP